MSRATAGIGVALSSVHTLFVTAGGSSSIVSLKLPNMLVDSMFFLQYYSFGQVFIAEPRTRDCCVSGLTAV